MHHCFTMFNNAEPPFLVLYSTLVQSSAVQVSTALHCTALQIITSLHTCYQVMSGGLHCNAMFRAVLHSTVLACTALH